MVSVDVKYHVHLLTDAEIEERDVKMFDRWRERERREREREASERVRERERGDK